MKRNIQTISLEKIAVTDSLFSGYMGNVARRLLPYQWDVLNDRAPGVEKTHCIDNFRIAAGDMRGHHRGAVFCDTDAYKWLEALAFCLQSGLCRELIPAAEELIDLISRAQESDGYLQTYFSIDHPDLKWKNLTEGHELYGAGHLIEAAIAYHQATGNTVILRVAVKLADLICRIFGEGQGQCRGYPGHQVIELALVKLYRLTGDKKYLEKARYFLDIRGRKPNYLLDELARTGRNRIFPEFSDYDEKYAQSHLPPVEQRSAEGHAVRAMYMYAAMADVAREYGDSEMRQACVDLWNNVTRRRMYITGGIGSSGHLERFTADYDLPNDRMYCESCASVGLMMFGQRMAALTGDAGYYDTVERALCNTVLGGIQAEGDRYFYVNPLEVWPDNCLPSTSMAHVKPVRQRWFAVACCPANIARTLASLGQYIYAKDEKSLYVNQLISSSVQDTVHGVPIRLEMDSSLMHSGQVRFRLSLKDEGSILLRIRIPSYWESPCFVLDGKMIHPALENGYAVLALSQPGEQRLTVSGKLHPRWSSANTLVRADLGKLALSYGPFVYCLEQTENGENLASVYVDPGESPQPTKNDTGLPGNLPLLRFSGFRLDTGVNGDALYGAPAFLLREESFTAVPYCLWCNREPGEMTVWLKALLPRPGT